ncbi:hypothetical protein HYDPIDRAFT_28283 [Hydnomerulius pinastri MD-312]|uniref:Uncharacterized protein n=1 Tax=Hydnomerulius pinastri MD-312 TaxID=994086 RepID=A0A0C9WG75_9AGAM|nr:hypothetical protein HYDPIDRAFT_28283 [Hydnomerulius pinastri MD-312]
MLSAATQSLSLDPALLVVAKSTNTEEPPLSFNDLLEIAHEYERAHKPETRPQRGNVMALENILSAIVVDAPSEGAWGREEGSVRAETYGSPWFEALEASANQLSTAGDTGRPDGGRQPHAAPSACFAVTEAKSAVSSMLLGWTPPNGSEVLDLELLEVDYPPWLAKLLAPGVLDLPAQFQPRSAEMGIAEEILRTAKVLQQPLEAAFPPPAQLPPTRVVLASIQARSSSNTPTPALPKPPRSRPHSTAVTTAKHASAPRGGVPPQLARTVTKANILRVEQERERMRAVVGGEGDGRKPSVLGGVGNVEGGGGMDFEQQWDGGSRGKRGFVWGGDRDGGRVVKRSRL